MKDHLRRVLQALKLATKVADRIPSRNDTLPQKIANVLSLFDGVNEVYGGGRSKMRDLTDRYSLVERESETFVRLFFATTLRDLFTLRRQSLDDKEDMIEAIGADGERIFFRETHYGNTRVESDFYVTPGVDFAKVIDALWAQYPDGIYLSITSESGGWRKETTICEVPCAPVERLSRAARDRLARTVDRHRLIAADGVHRCYLCFGPAGTGKSSFAVLFARALGGRALKFDATSLPVLGVKDFGFLLDALRPNFLIIDDLDRAPLAEVGARVLFLLERFKTHYPQMTIVLSVNDPSKLDAALLRCGRIDVPLEFDAPERDEIEQMVRTMLVGHGLDASHVLVARIADVAISERLSHAYLDDLCRRLRHEQLDDVLASVALLKRLAESAVNGGQVQVGKPCEPQRVAG